MEMWVAIQQRLRQLCLEQDMTIHKLAECSGLPPVSYTHLDVYKRQDIASNVTEDEVEKAEELLQLYSPLLRRAAQGIDDMEDFCVDSRRQSISDFITLAIDYDHDGDSKRIADRLAAMGHSMQLLSLMDAALVPCLLYTSRCV